MKATLRSALAGLAAAAAVAVLFAAQPAVVAEPREAVAGWISQRIGPPASGRVAVVDIDAAAVAAEGPWPWPRETTARLIEAIAAARPKALAVDIVLARRCGDEDPGNGRLAAALAAAPSTLGFVLPGPDAPPAAKAAIALRQPVNLPGLWQSAGGEFPCAEFRDAAEGLGLVSLAGGGSATVIAVPALARVDQSAFPGLAVDVVRLATGAGTLIVRGAPDTELASGGFAAPLTGAGEMALHASRPDTWQARTLSAASVLAGDAAVLADKVVILGSSLPQAGALRPTMTDPLTPSAQIHADVVESLLTASLPMRPASAMWLELALLAAGAGAATFAALRLRPTFTAGLTLALMAAVLGGAGAPVPALRSSRPIRKRSPSLPHK